MKTCLPSAEALVLDDADARRDKFPRGAEIDGVGITWAQHGVVTGKDGARLAVGRRRRTAVVRDIEDRIELHATLVGVKYMTMIDAVLAGCSDSLK